MYAGIHRHLTNFIQTAIVRPPRFLSFHPDEEMKLKGKPV
jgi:hypothetical protein